MSVGLWILLGMGVFLIIVIIYDLVQTKHAILHNFPVVGHLRYILEGVGPELRQYIVTNNDEERPFSRDQRRWVYASSKLQNNYFGFGTDNDLEISPSYPVVKHVAFPLHEPHPGEPHYDPLYMVPCAKVMGGFRQRKKAFRPSSIVNISAMSFGSLSSNAVSALNQGSAIAKCMHNTGEGGVSPYHEKGGDLIWQLGTGYFGARDEDGNFSLERLKDKVESCPHIRAIEVKLSQGAKPGRGGVLPGAKVTPEIARIRGIPVGKDCISPAYHKAFSDASSMLDFIEKIADETGLPVGIKSAIGDLQLWHDLAQLMDTTGRAPDYIQIDGGEGGTGAAPLVFSDHVSLPFKIGMNRVYRIFAERGLDDKMIFIGSGRLGFPHQAIYAMAMGCDMIGVAREAMLAIGCIQAQRCHTDHCPTGVATQNRWLVRGLDPTHKAGRFANYLMILRKEIMWLTRACGVEHPGLITLEQLEILDEQYGSRTAREVFDYETHWGLPGPADREAIIELMRATPDGRMKALGLV